MRIALGIEYDGSRFSGWQRQHHARSVQAELERALSQVAAHPVVVHCAGRTDSGVHASYQVAHFETQATREARAWTFGANAHLPADVAVLWARPVPETFHARFSARSRAYEYVICNRPTRPGLFHGRVTWECRPLDVSHMASAARHWLGEHDFSSFRAQGCQSRHPIRTVERCDISADSGFITVQVEANAFLQHMVRNFAGVLIDIGRGKRPPEWALEVLEKRSRAAGGVTAPPHGLTLVAVRYPEDYALPPPGGHVRFSATAGAA